MFKFELDSNEFDFTKRFENGKTFLFSYMNMGQNIAAPP
jgi:hypothetical protein